MAMSAISTASFLPRSICSKWCGRAFSVQATKSPEQRQVKKQKRKEFLERRKEAATWKAATQLRDHWYEVREDGVWQEHRRPQDETKPEGKRGNAATSGYTPTLEDLLAVSLRDPPPPPAEWMEPQFPVHSIPQPEPTQQQGQQRQVKRPSQPWKNPKRFQAWKEQQKQPEP